MLRYIILDVLSEAPQHGYEIIKQVEERTGGRYSPSPGTLYPTLQYLEDLGYVTSSQQEGRKVYQLTDEGKAHLQEHAIHAKDFWSRFHGAGRSGAVMHEINFLRDSLHDLNRTVGSALRDGAIGGNAEVIRNVRAVLERAQNDIRQIVAGSATSDGGTEARRNERSTPESDAGTRTTAL